ncbi:MAG TPA: hypothetical protein VH724_03020, partial [Candidatus Angelobacter sp.]|nr:hypothetical protein [Candidatus Angelobacter sp.]
MRFTNFILVLLFGCGIASAQEAFLASASAPPAPNGIADMAEAPLLGPPLVVPSLAAPPTPRFQQMKDLIKHQIARAIDGKRYPLLEEWRPLTAREKFQVFLHSTYSPRTFANAAIDEAADRAKGNHLNREYERGFRGVGQRYGINLATNETDVFFQRFLFPTLLRQDPRYFRNPDLPFFQRALYAMSRVLITRTDNGGQAFNSSRILSIAASRAVSDLYVPGERQGMHPIGACVSFTLLRDAGENLLHEFWP